jgi:uncharacterized protein YecE (DUF72 family)
MRAWIGTSGWSYNHWQGSLYRHGASAKERLDCYLARYDTVEVNSSYYHWPRDATFDGWKARLPAGFRMTVKAPRGLTHSKKLHEPEVWLERIERGLSRLGDRLGIFLVQLPPGLGFDPPRLEYFLQQAPKWIRLAFEFRNGTWEREETYALLERYGAASCVMSGARLPCVLRATAPFVYVRFHGPDPNHMYGGSYSDEDLRWWAGRVREWLGQGREVWAYFNNDWEGNALRNADRLKELLA